MQVFSNSVLGSKTHQHCNIAPSVSALFVGQQISTKQHQQQHPVCKPCHQAVVAQKILVLCAAFSDSDPGWPCASESQPL